MVSIAYQIKELSFDMHQWVEDNPVNILFLIKGPLILESNYPFYRGSIKFLTTLYHSRSITLITLDPGDHFNNTPCIISVITRFYYTLPSRS